MSYDRSEIPVPSHKSGIRVIASEYTVINAADPYISLIRFPGIHRFRTGNDCPQRLLAAIGNSGILRSSIHRIHIFPVNARRN